MEAGPTAVRGPASVLAAVAMVPAVVGAALGWLAGGVIGLVVGFIVLGSAAPLGVWRRAGQLTTGGLGAPPADRQAQARLFNLVEGLCVSSGVAPPDVRVLPAAGLNVATVGRDEGRSTLVVTSALLERLPLIELEGILAVAIAGIRRGDTRAATVVAAAWGLGVDRVLSPTRDAAIDDAGVTVTRYPPGLAAAYTTLMAEGTAVRGVTRSLAPLWLADPRPPGSPPAAYRTPLDQRLAALEER